MTSSQVDRQLVLLCDEVVSATGVTACGVMMATNDGQGLTAHTSDTRAKAVEDLQHTLGEGPGILAHLRCGRARSRSHRPARRRHR